MHSGMAEDEAWPPEPTVGRSSTPRRARAPAPCRTISGSTRSALGVLWQKSQRLTRHAEVFLHATVLPSAAGQHRVIYWGRSSRTGGGPLQSRIRTPSPVPQLTTKSRLATLSKPSQRPLATPTPLRHSRPRTTHTLAPFPRSGSDHTVTSSANRCRRSLRASGQPCRRTSPLGRQVPCRSSRSGLHAKSDTRRALAGMTPSPRESVARLGVLGQFI